MSRGKSRADKLDDILYRYAMGELELTDEQADAYLEEYNALVPDAQPAAHRSRVRP